VGVELKIKVSKREKKYRWKAKHPKDTMIRKRMILQRVDDKIYKINDIYPEGNYTRYRKELYSKRSQLIPEEGVFHCYDGNKFGSDRRKQENIESYTPKTFRNKS